MNEQIEMLYNKVDKQNQIIDEQVLEISKLKQRIDNAIEYIKLATDNITEYLDIKEIKELLEILGDRKQEEYKLTKDENGTTQINGEWYKVEKIK